MRRIGMFVFSVIVAACRDDVHAETDAVPVDAASTDATTADRPIDGLPAPVPECSVTMSIDPPPGDASPAPGSYCATWTRLHGLQDPFARYYDRADIELGAQPAVRWWTSGSGGAKEYLAGASVADGCLEVDPFVAPGEYQGSDTVILCWESATTATATLGWCSPALADARWTVRLTPCP